MLKALKDVTQQVSREHGPSQEGPAAAWMERCTHSTPTIAVTELENASEMAISIALLKINPAAKLAANCSPTSSMFNLRTVLLSPRDRKTARTPATQHSAAVLTPM
jgi:hypothetical protein